MVFKLSKRSLSKLEGVDPRLVEIVHSAIKLTKVDFGVTEGLRTVQRQQELVKSGASQTMDSKHIKGLAVDVVAYIGSRISWELPLYCDIAEAFKESSRQLKYDIIWGGAWHVKPLSKWKATMQEALDDYINTRRSEGRRVFIDGPHFELVK
jgi:peptidoglycan L-alanyl-D-glutamate endopeptidase CwlK